MILSSGTIFISLVLVLVTIGLCVGLFFLIKFNIKKYNEENNIINDKSVTKNEMIQSISSYIKKVGRFGDFSLIYIDIDNFTSMNEIFGKDQCDDFLAEILDRFTKRLPYRTVFSRFQNDEFLIFIKDNLAYAQVTKIADSLLADVRQKLFVSTTDSISLTASCGICLYPSCGKTTHDLLKNLELATYISKKEGGNKYTVYYSTLSNEESNNFKFFQEIKQAIANKEFCLYYQPMIDINKKELFAFEALMRWNHPTEGVLPPSRFINIMDQSGDVYWVGKWGLDLIAKKVLELKTFSGNENLRISLNLSAKQLSYEELADDLIQIAKKNSLLPSSIIFEVGGYTVFEKMANVKQNLMRLRDFGFLIAVDGFEMDYATLTRIQKEPIDIIKLNKSFLEDINNNEIKEKFVKLLSESADLASKIVIAEGVENKEEEEYILNKGIGYGQGYYYSKPLSEDLLDEFIRYKKWENPGSVTVNGTESVNKEEESTSEVPDIKTKETKEDEVGEPTKETPLEKLDETSNEETIEAKEEVKKPSSVKSYDPDDEDEDEEEEEDEDDEDDE